MSTFAIPLEPGASSRPIAIFADLSPTFSDRLRLSSRGKPTLGATTRICPDWRGAFAWRQDTIFSPRTTFRELRRLLPIETGAFASLASRISAEGRSSGFSSRASPKTPLAFPARTRTDLFFPSIIERLIHTDSSPRWCFGFRTRHCSRACEILTGTLDFHAPSTHRHALSTSNHLRVFARTPASSGQ